MPARLALLTLANVTGMNLYHFARLFRDSVGTSPHRYVLEQRIKHAKQLLQDTKTSAFEDAVGTGFSD
jgi:AraC family transcriptional regulator